MDPSIPDKKIDAAVVPDSNRPPIKQSTAIWGASSFVVAIVLAVIAAMKHDLRWLLWFALPFGVFALWEASAYLRIKRVWRYGATFLCSCTLAMGLWGLAIWLRPEKPSGKKPESQLAQQQNQNPLPLPQNKPEPPYNSTTKNRKKRRPSVPAQPQNQLAASSGSGTTDSGTGNQQPQQAQPTQPSNQQRCEDGSLCNQDSTVNAPQTVNNYGQKPPQILGYELTLPDDLRWKWPHPGIALTSFKFYTDTVWDDPKFLAICDRPCRAFSVEYLKSPGTELSPNFQTGPEPDQPNLAIFVLLIKPFPSDTYFVFTVASEDSEPVKIVKFRPLKMQSKPQ